MRDTRDRTSSTTTGRATSRGLVTAARASGHFRLVGARRRRWSVRTRRCWPATATMVLHDPARLRARRSCGRGTAPVQLVVNAEKGAAGGRDAGRTRSGSSRSTRRELAATLTLSTPGGRRAVPGRAAHRRARARLVQPDAQLPALHGAGHPRRARDDDRHAADGAEHRAREGARDARAAQRHADHARAVHRRQAAAVLGRSALRGLSRSD